MCLNESQSWVFFSIVSYFSMHWYAQKISNLIKFCDHVIKTSLNDDLRVLSANYLNLGISRIGWTK